MPGALIGKKITQPEPPGHSIPACIVSRPELWPIAAARGPNEVHASGRAISNRRIQYTCHNPVARAEHRQSFPAN